MYNIVFHSRTIASTLKKDTTAPDYPFHDDPYLIPYNSMDKRIFLLSKLGGKEAARFVLNQHPDLFQDNLIEMQPKIKAFMPKLIITEKNATIDLLETLVQGCNVTDAMTTFKFLKERNVEIGHELKQDYLEMLCFHNSGEEEEKPENYNEFKGWNPDVEPKWNRGGEAEHLASLIIQEHGIQSPGADKARLALLLGRSKFEDHKGVLQIFEEVKVNGGQLNTEAFNSIIKAKSTKEKCEWKEIRQLLETMHSQGIQPDRLTLHAVLFALGQSQKKSDQFKTILSVLAEFKRIGIEPSLGAYRELILILKDGSHRMVVKDILKFIGNPQSTAWIFFSSSIKSYIFSLILGQSQKAKGSLIEDCVSESCFRFFREAMALARTLLSPEIAHQINDIVENDPNGTVLLGGGSNVQTYYTFYMQVLVRKLPIDEAAKYVYIYQPHIWSPNTQFINEFVKQITLQKASHLIPQLWTDLEASQFYRANRETRLELLKHVALAIKAVEDRVEERDILSKVVEGMFESFADGYGRQRFNPTAIDAAICNHCLELSLIHKHLKLAQKIVQFCQAQVTELPDNLSSENMINYITAMVDEENTIEAYQGILFMNELQMTEDMVEVAIEASKKLRNFNLTQKQALNSMFSSSSKWVML